MTDPRNVKTLVLAAWAAFFIWLLISKSVNVYIGPRTYWVVLFGAVCLTLVTVGQMLLRPVESEGPSRHWWVGYATLLTPILLVVVVPDPSLGSLAASRKSPGGIVSAAALVPPDAGEAVSFEQISYALESDEYAAQLGIGEGYEVDLVGFVSVNDDSSFETFSLSRFSIFCCAADAVPYTVSVRSDGKERFELDQWLRVRGVLMREGDTLVISSEDIEPIDTPDDPYI